MIEQVIKFYKFIPELNGKFNVDGRPMLPTKHTYDSIKKQYRDQLFNSGKNSTQAKILQDGFNKIIVKQNIEINQFGQNIKASIPQVLRAAREQLDKGVMEDYIINEKLYKNFSDYFDSLAILNEIINGGNYAQIHELENAIEDLNMGYSILKNEALKNTIGLLTSKTANIEKKLIEGNVKTLMKDFTKGIKNKNIQIKTSDSQILSSSTEKGIDGQSDNTAIKIHIMGEDLEPLGENRLFEIIGGNTATDVLVYPNARQQGRALGFRTAASSNFSVGSYNIITLISNLNTTNLNKSLMANVLSSRDYMNGVVDDGEQYRNIKDIMFMQALAGIDIWDGPLSSFLVVATPADKVEPIKVISIFDMLFNPNTDLKNKKSGFYEKYIHTNFGPYAVPRIQQKTNYFKDFIRSSRISFTIDLKMDNYRKFLARRTLTS